MTESIIITSTQTEDLSAASRAEIIQVCIAAHQEEDFKNLFSYVPSGGWQRRGLMEKTARRRILC